jgi:hypothetical protein
MSGLMRLVPDSILYVAGTVIIVRLSGVAPLEPGDSYRLQQDLDYLSDVLEAMSSIWPAANRSSLSLRQLAQEYCYAA